MLDSVKLLLVPGNATLRREPAITDPIATYVERRWAGDPGAPGGKANRVGFAYLAHVPGEIAGWDPVLRSSVAADVVEVEAAVRGLAAHSHLLGALLWPLLRAEAIASSRIEGLAVSHERLALTAAGAGGDDHVARAVLGNLDALRAALDRGAEPITTATLTDIHRILLAGTAQEGIAGAVRTEQNWIGGRHPNPRGAAFVPPPPEEVGRLLDDLCRFCERDDLPAVVQAAIAHVQFETIHPFADGNGRVGRALIQAILRRRGLTGGGPGDPGVAPPISLALAAHSDAYIAGLSAFREGDHIRWVEFFLQAVHRACAIAEDLVQAIAALQADWRERAGRPRRGSAAAALIERLPASPVIDLAGARALTRASSQATRLAINRLEAAGVLWELTGKGRLRRWEVAGLFGRLESVDQFSAGSSSPGLR
ncbi:MAG: Fic family protein [Miltoncostaeaceae bacterium]